MYINPSIVKKIPKKRELLDHLRKGDRISFYFNITFRNDFSASTHRKFDPEPVEQIGKSIGENPSWAIKRMMLTGKWDW